MRIKFLAQGNNYSSCWSSLGFPFYTGPVMKLTSKSLCVVYTNWPLHHQLQASTHSFTVNNCCVSLDRHHHKELVKNSLENMFIVHFTFFTHSSPIIEWSQKNVSMVTESLFFNIYTLYVCDGLFSHMLVSLIADVLHVVCRWNA